MLVAEELECDWSKVRAEYASAHDQLTRNRVYVSMSTGGSRSVRQSHEYLRQAGATAREMLVAAAAEHWGVPASDCRAAHGTITHEPSGRKTTFGGVATEASKHQPPTQLTLKDPSQWKLIGKSVKRLDTAQKVLGAPVFGTDVQLPGMLYAAIRACPVFGGKVASYQEGAITDRAGVRRVVSLGDAVAVVAETTWQAQQALNALPIVWDEGLHGKLDSEKIHAALREGIEADEAAVARQDGDVEAALPESAKLVTAEYYAPYLAHATLEPMNCTARVTAERVEVWAPTQNAEATLAAAARAAGVGAEKVYVHNTFLGGGFGQRGAFQDSVEQAVRIAKALGKPVQLLWSREEDMRHDFYGPASMARLTAGLNDRGLPIAWKVRVSAPSTLDAVRPGKVVEGMDPLSLQGMDSIPYAIAHQVVEYSMRNAHVPVGFWRSVNHSQNAFFQECFLNEAAHAGGHDAYELRRKLLPGRPKELKALEAAAG
jgi:isoquinoline 1-oxidoreductase beta subunit